MPDIPITIPADEAFRDEAIRLLWPSAAPGSAQRRGQLEYQQKYINIAVEALRDAYIRGAHDVTVHYEAPKDRTWVVTVPLAGTATSTHVVQAPEWGVTPDGMLLLGRSYDDGKRFLPETGGFAAGRWISVVLQPEVNTAGFVS